MTPDGWTFLIVSVGFVSLAFTWCVIRVLRTPDETERLHGLELDTPDQHETQ